MRRFLLERRTRRDPFGGRSGEDCARITLSGFSSGSGFANWTLTNGSTELLEIRSIYLDWPASNGEWQSIQLNSAELWGGSQSHSPGLVEASAMGGDRTVVPAIPNSLTLTFANDRLEAAEYILVIEFTNGCFVNDVR